jgi:4-amino-4-deoxy-L-arabinose transferase-like glycosyltransferase
MEDVARMSVSERLPEAAARETTLATRRPNARWSIWAVALVALAHGLLWSVLIPPFQSPDETEHFAYTQYLAETGRLPPKVGNKQYSTEEIAVFNALGTIGIKGTYLGKPAATDAASDAVAAELRRTETEPRADGGGPSTASSQPPLAYALWAIPYRLGSDGSIPTRLWLMRLLSVAWFVATVVGVALLVRELLPSWPWAPVVGGLVVALQPAFAFIAVSVNPDTLLFAVSTFALLVAVRILRHGLTLRRAGVLGALVGAGLVTKLTFLGLVPGLALALAFGLARCSQGRVRIGATAVGAAAVLPAAYLVWAVLQGRGLMPPAGGTILLAPGEQASSSLSGLLSYAWQLYLPRPPWMHDFFGFWPPYTTWVSGFIGRFGWLDYGLRGWIYPVGATLLALVAVLVVAALARAQRVRRRWRELTVFAACAIVLFAQIAFAGYDYHNKTGFVFEQTRYLYPLIGFYGAGIVTACTAFGRRLAPTFAATFVGIATLHALAAVFATVARYYG